MLECCLRFACVLLALYLRVACAMLALCLRLACALLALCCALLALCLRFACALLAGWLKPIGHQSGEPNLVIWRAIPSGAIWRISSWPIWQLQSGSTCVYTRNASVLPIWRRTQSGNLDRGSIKPICCQNQSACGEIGSSHCPMQSTGHGRALTHALHPRAAPTRVCCAHALRS